MTCHRSGFYANIYDRMRVQELNNANKWAMSCTGKKKERKKEKKNKKITQNT